MFVFSVLPFILPFKDFCSFREAYKKHIIYFNEWGVLYAFFIDKFVNLLYNNRHKLNIMRSVICMLKKLISSVIVVAMLVSVLPVLAMSDIADHWASNEIQRWTDFGVIRGYDDGTFRPDNHITRAEFVAIINRVLGSTQQSEAEFSDVNPNSWYAVEIAKAVASGYMRGDVGGTMRPNDNVTREEAVVMLFRAFNVTLTQQNELEFADNNYISYWAVEAVSAFTNMEIITGFTDNTFRPQNNITRAETVVLIDRVGLNFYLATNRPQTVMPPAIGGGSGGGSGGGNFGGGGNRPQQPQPPIDDELVFEIPSEIRVVPWNGYIINILQLSDNAVVEFNAPEVWTESGHVDNILIDEIGRQILLRVNWWGAEPDNELTLEFTATRGDETLTRQIKVIIVDSHYSWDDMINVHTEVILPNINDENAFINYMIWFRDINTGRIYGGRWTQLPIGEFEVIAGGVLQRNNNSGWPPGGSGGLQESLYDVVDLSAFSGGVAPMPPPPRPFVIPEHEFEFVPSVRPQNVVITQADVDDFQYNWETKELPPITLVSRATRLFSVSGTITAPSGITGTAYVTLQSRLSDFFTGDVFYTRTIEIPINGVNTQYRFDNIPIGVYDIIVDMNQTDIAQISTVLTQNRTNQNITLVEMDREMGRVAGTITIDRAVDFDVTVWVSLSRGYSNFVTPDGPGSSWSITYWSQGFVITAGQTSVNFHSIRLPVGEYDIFASAGNTLTSYIGDTIYITNTTIQRNFEFIVGHRISGRVENWQRLTNELMANRPNRWTLSTRLYKDGLVLSGSTIDMWPRPSGPWWGGGNFSFNGLDNGTYTIRVILSQWVSGTNANQTIVLAERELVVNNADIMGVNFNLANVELPAPEIYHIEFDGAELSQDPDNPTVLPYACICQVKNQPVNSIEKPATDIG